LAPGEDLSTNHVLNLGLREALRRKNKQNCRFITEVFFKKKDIKNLIICCYLILPKTFLLKSRFNRQPLIPSPRQKNEPVAVNLVQPKRKGKIVDCTDLSLVTTTERSIDLVLPETYVTRTGPQNPSLLPEPPRLSASELAAERERRKLAQAEYEEKERWKCIDLYLSRTK